MNKLTIFVFCAFIISTVAHAEMTVEKLMALQNKAIDKTGAYLEAKTSMSKQKIELKGQEKPFGYVMQYFKAPNKSKSEVYIDGSLNYTQLFNGNQCWMVSADGKKVTEITGTALEMQKLLVSLSNPKKDMNQIFKKIDLTKKDLNDRTYYLLTCYPPNKDLEPILIYIDMEDYLPKRMEFYLYSGGDKYNSITTYDKYAVVSGVRMVERTTINVRGTTQYYTLEDFKMNIPLPDSEFEPAMPYKKAED